MATHFFSTLLHKSSQFEGSIRAAIYELAEASIHVEISQSTQHIEELNTILELIRREKAELLYSKPPDIVKQFTTSTNNSVEAGDAGGAVGVVNVSDGAQHEWGETRVFPDQNNWWGRECKKCSVRQNYGKAWGSNKHPGYSPVHPVCEQTNVNFFG